MDCMASTNSFDFLSDEQGTMNVAGCIGSKVDTLETLKMRLRALRNIVTPGGGGISVLKGSGIMFWIEVIIV